MILIWNNVCTNLHSTVKHGTSILPLPLSYFFKFPNSIKRNIDSIWFKTIVWIYPLYHLCWRYDVELINLSYFSCPICSPGSERVKRQKAISCNLWVKIWRIINTSQNIIFGILGQYLMENIVNFEYDH